MKKVVLGSLVVLVALSAAQFVPAAKPGGGGTAPPPPAGTIFFNYNYPERLAMRADGSAKTPASSYSVNPSSRVYGTDPVLDRWSLVIAITNDGSTYPGTSRPRREVFALRAYRSGNELLHHWVQVTNTYPEIDLGFLDSEWVRWSNDEQDSFISFRGTDRETGIPNLYRIAVTGTEIDAAPTETEPSGTAAGLANVEDLESVVIAPSNEDSHFYSHSWSPDGDSVAYWLTVPYRDFGRSALFVTHVPTGTSTKVYEYPDGVLGSLGHTERWSPDPANNKIAIGLGDGLWTVSPDGTNLTRLLASTSKESYSHPRWSPDGKHILCCVRRRTGHYVARIPAAGGSITTLTNDLDPSRVGNWETFWVSDTAAPLPVN